MKTVKSGEEMKRVSDVEAAKMVNNGWKYVPKSEWKARKDKKSVVVKDSKEVVETAGDGKEEARQSKKSRKNWQKKSIVE